MRFRLKTLIAFAGFLALGATTKNTLAGNDAYEADCFSNGRTVTLDYDGESFSENTSIPLKDVILRRCHRLHPSDLNRLSSVTLVAKAKSDYARASLTVGNYRSPSYSLPRDYRTINLQAPNGQRNFDAWRVDFRGKVKIERIVVYLRGYMPRAPLPPVVRRAPVVVHRPGPVVRRTGRVVRRARRAVRRVHRAVRRAHRRAHRNHRGRANRPCGRGARR